MERDLPTTGNVGERVCVSAADQSERRLSQTLRSFRSAPRLLQTVTMDDVFCFRKPTTYSKYQKVKNYRKLRDLFYLKNKFLNTASGIVLLLLFKCFSSLSSLHYPFIETDQQVPHLSWP